EGSLSSERREVEDEARAPTRRVLEGEAAVLFLDDSAGEPEPEAGAARGFARREEGLEDALLQRVGDAGARVAHLEAHAVARAVRPDLDAVVLRAAGGDLLGGVHDEVEHALGEARAAAARVHAVGQGALDPRAAPRLVRGDARRRERDLGKVDDV